MPFKRWTRERLPSADFNAYVQEQVVNRFASGAERDSQWPDAPDGAVTFLEDVAAYQNKRLGYWRGAWDIRMGTVVVTTNAAGGGVVTFDWPFQRSAYAITMTSGDSGAFRGWFVIIGYQKSPGECGFQAFLAPDVGAEGVIRVDYIAVAYQG